MLLLCICLFIVFISSSWVRGVAVACDCGTPWTVNFFGDLLSDTYRYIETYPSNSHVICYSAFGICYLIHIDI